LNKVITKGSNDERQHISNYANQPANLSQGAQQAASSLMNGITNSFNAISTGGLWQLPNAVIHPAIGGLDAIRGLTLGLRNMVDKSEYETANEKYKRPENEKKK